MQQLQNTNAGYAAQLAQLRNMLNANQNSGGMLPYPSWLPQQLNPNTSPLSPIKYING
jgi:hypothetical protein